MNEFERYTYVSSKKTKKKILKKKTKRKKATFRLKKQFYTPEAV